MGEQALPPGSGVCLAPCFFQASPVVHLQGRGTIPALGDSPFPGSAGCLFQVNLRPSTGARDLLQRSARSRALQSSHVGGQGSFVSFALYLCTPLPGSDGGAHGTPTFTPIDLGSGLSRNFCVFFYTKAQEKAPGFTHGGHKPGEV